MGHIVKNFTELVTKVATLSFLNSRYFFLFRGQKSDYHTQRGRVSLFPKIYRNEPGKTVLQKGVRKQRFSDLNAKRSELRAGYSTRLPYFIKEFRKLQMHHELCWAILQHYGIVPTPYLDATASLRVAASFALLSSDSGYVYIFGLPYPTGSITHVVDEDIKIVRLQAACPPSAVRPHFQDGFLIGSCYVDQEEGRGNQNFSRRLITKFYIPDRGEFWDLGRFDPIPEDALYPGDDNNFDWLK